MNFNAYQEMAMSFRLPTANTEYALLNLSGEVGELHSLMAKAIRDGNKPDFIDNIVKELGDILWCVAAVAIDYDIKLDEVAKTNIDKLNKRTAKGTLQGSGDDR